MKNIVKPIIAGTSVVLGLLALGVTANASTVIVKSGDTVGQIANTYGDTISNIVSVNGLADANVIYVGEKLSVGSSSYSTPSEANKGTYQAYKGTYKANTPSSNGSTSEVQNSTNSETISNTSGTVAEQAAELMAQKTGVSASEWAKIIQRESNGETTVSNPNSSAHGLFQQLNETSNDWRTQVNDAANLYNKQGLSAWSETK